MNDMYASFRTSKDMEKAGVYLDYGKFRVKIARAGGSNKAFQKLMEVKMRPFKRAIQTDTLDPETGNDIVRDVYSKTVVLGVDTKGEGDKWQVGMMQHPTSGEMVKSTPEMVALLLKEIPDLFTDVVNQASNMAIFREEVLESDAGN